MSFLARNEHPCRNGEDGSSTQLEFAGLKFRLEGLETAQISTIARRFGQGRTIDEEPSRSCMEVSIGQTDIPARDMATLLSPAGDYMPSLVHEEHRVQVFGHDFDAIVTRKPELSASLRIRETANLSLDQVENCLRILSAYAVLDRGGLFLHSACVVIDGEAILFLGRSGAGKSTISRLALSHGATVLSDDANIILPAARGGFTAAAVPFSGDLGQSAQVAQEGARISRIFWLDRSEPVGIHRQKRGLQTSRMLACASAANADPYRFNQTVEVIQSVLDVLPMQVLSFRKDQSFTECLLMMRDPGSSE
jgi:hypothetical protein